MCQFSSDFSRILFFNYYSRRSDNYLHIFYFIPMIWNGVKILKTLTEKRELIYYEIKYNFSDSLRFPIPILIIE